MDDTWKIIAAVAFASVGIAFATSLSKPTKTNVDRRNECVASVKDRKTEEIISICGRP
jgi:hypothetical protein